MLLLLPSPAQPLSDIIFVAPALLDVHDYLHRPHRFRILAALVPSPQLPPRAASRACLLKKKGP